MTPVQAKAVRLSVITLNDVSWDLVRRGILHMLDVMSG
jgi:hypothetical protein